MPQANYCGHGRTAFENERISRTASFPPFLNTANEFEQTAEAGGSGDGGDKYTGLDRFGRLVQTLWKKGNAVQVQTRYGRNRFGGVVWRRDDRAHAQTPTAVTTEDNYYLYDGTNQIKERKRGNLAGTSPNYTGIDPIQQQENWTYDAAGNWTRYSNPSTAAGHTQDREHNDGNELWKISVSGLGEVWPIYDSMGNMRTLPKAPGVSTDQSTLKWDAWNRLVEVKEGSTVVASYTYDGLNRRLTKTAGSETRHYYYDTQWRTLEERVGSSSTPDRQYTWGLRDRWDLLRRKRSTTNRLDETLYVLRDYLDPVAIADAAGNVVERYAYDAFGNVRFLDQNYGSRSSSSYAWDFLFHGEFRDPETKLYNYGHRYYDTGLGRWLSRDPIEEEGGWNLYAMVGNSPTDNVDSFGLGLYKWLYTGDWNASDDDYDKAIDVHANYVMCYLPCIKDVFEELTSVLLIGAGTGAAADSAMELPWQRKLRSGFGSKEELQSLGNTLYKLLRNHSNKYVRAFAEWARTAGTWTRAIPGLRSESPTVRRIAKFARTGARGARGGLTGTVVVGSGISLYATYYCTKKCYNEFF
jgi:RHS repeat-associated protein